MQLSRSIVKCLAYIVGILGALCAGIGPLLLLAVATGYIPTRLQQGDRSVWTFFVVTTTVMGVLGYLIVRQAWIHVRRPDRGTANAVMGIATFFLGGEFFHLASKRNLIPRPSGPADSTTELLFMLGVLVTFYLLHRLVMKRIAKRAYPAAESSEPSAETAAQP